MPTGTLGVDRAPRIDKEVLSQGIVVTQKHNRIRIFADDGRLVVRGSVEGSNSPVSILGLSPEGDRLFYVSGDSIPGRPQLRIIDFGRGTDEAAFSLEDYAAIEVMFHPTKPLIYVVFDTRPGVPFKLYRASWLNGRAEGFTDITRQHPILAGCGGGFSYLAFTADGSRIFFDTCFPEAKTHKGLPEAIRPEPPEVNRDDQVLYMDPDGQVRTLSMGLPGFACASPAPSPTENVVAVDCWRYPERTERNVYLVRLEDGTNPSVERMTDLAPGEQMRPRLWSTDGRYLVGWDRQQPSAVIYVLDVRSREVKRVRPSKGWLFVPTEWQWDPGPGYRLYALEVPNSHEPVGQPRRLVRVDLLSGEIEQVLPDEIHRAWVRLTSPNRRIR